MTVCVNHYWPLPLPPPAPLGYPYCWEYLAPVLCSLYLPNCRNERYEVLERSVCRKVRKRCAFALPMFPNYLRSCSTARFYSTAAAQPANCTLTRKSVAVAPFNRTCAPPLRYTEREDSFYGGVELCGVGCAALEARETHARLRVLVVAAYLCATACSAFAVATATLSWRRTRRYPQAVAFYANVCLLVAGVACCLQLLPGARRDIVCRRDGTTRHSEPRIAAGESATCALVFAVLYYAGAAATAWFGALAFAWRVSFAALRREPYDGGRRLRRCAGYLHVWAWCAPLVLTIACLASAGVEGHAFAGVCFVAAEWRVVYVLVPAGGVVFAALAMIGDGAATLRRLGGNSARLMSPLARRKLAETVTRVTAFGGAAFACFAGVCASHALERWTADEREDALRKLVLCRLKPGSTTPGEADSCAEAEVEYAGSPYPTLAAVFCFLTMAAAMSSFAWTGDAAVLWRRFLKRRLAAIRGAGDAAATKGMGKKRVEKHKIIAEAFKVL